MLLHVIMINVGSLACLSLALCFSLLYYSPVLRNSLAFSLSLPLPPRPRANERASEKNLYILRTYIHRVFLGTRYYELYEATRMWPVALSFSWTSSTKLRTRMCLVLILSFSLNFLNFDFASLFTLTHIVQKNSSTSYSTVQVQLHKHKSEQDNGDSRRCSSRGIPCEPTRNYPRHHLAVLFN